MIDINALAIASEPEYFVNNKETVHVPPALRAGTQGYMHAVSKKYLKEWKRDVRFQTGNF